MRFNGDVALDAPPAIVWKLLTDESELQRLAPNVLGAEVVIPGQHYHLDLGVAAGNQTLQKRFDLYWRDLVAERSLTWEASTGWGDDRVEMVAQIALAGVDQTQLTFDVDVVKLPRSFPAPLAHSLIANALRQFFTNLKATAAQQATLL